MCRMQIGKIIKPRQWERIINKHLILGNMGMSLQCCKYSCTQKFNEIIIMNYGNDEILRKL